MAGYWKVFVIFCPMMVKLKRLFGDLRVFFFNLWDHGIIIVINRLQMFMQNLNV